VPDLQLGGEQAVTGRVGRLTLVAALGCGGEAVGDALQRAAAEADARMPEPPPFIPDEPWVRESRVRSGEAELFVREVGPSQAGQTVLVLHGGPGHSHDYLRPLELAAAGDLRIVFFDQRGIGRSTAPMDAAEKYWNLAAYRGDVQAVRRHVGAAKVHLIGFSWGGILVMDFAIHHPRHVASLALVASGWPHAASRKDWDAYRQRHRELVNNGDIGPAPDTFEDCTARADYLIPIYFADPHHPAAARETGAVCSEQVTRATWSAVGKFDLRRQLSGVTMPTLVFHGAQDHVVPPKVARTTYGAIGTKARLVVEEGCGHRVADECRPALLRELQSLWNAPGLADRADGPVPPPDPDVFAESRRRAKERDQRMRASATHETDAAQARDAGPE
jgi:pimeloyl-ACP methyl ester carboxylesterase